MPKWTEKQQDAIIKSGFDLLVSAAAGSGKTAVLSERILYQILHLGADIDQFLVVTFTNSAASEMRQRILKKLHNAFEQDPDNRHIMRQLSLISHAKIMTIHSFCLDIIRQNIHLLDVDVRFKLSDTPQTTLLKLRAADDLMQLHYDGPMAAQFSFLCDILAGGKDAVFANLLIDFYDKLRSTKDPISFLKEQTALYAQASDTDDLVWVQNFVSDCKNALNDILGGWKQTMNFASSHGLDSYYDKMLQDYPALVDLSAQSNFIDFYQKAQTISFTALRGVRAKDANIDDVQFVKRNLTLMKKSVQDIIKQVLDLVPSDIPVTIANLSPAMDCLYLAIADFDKLLDAQKRKSGMLEFSDLEHLALKILCDKQNGVAQTYQAQFREIFVDEYQDCNAVQEALFQSICRGQEGSCNLFMVGDVKQSIYRFRQADPTIFLGKESQYTEVLDGESSKIMLNKNFRSRPQVLNFINHLFAKIMSPAVGEIEYNEGQMLYHGLPYPKEDHTFDEKPTFLITTQCPDEDVQSDTEEDDDDDTNAKDKTTLEAQMVAEEILVLMRSGKQILDGDSYRSLKFSDIVVLMRAVSGRATIFEQVFKQYGIPCFADGGGGYFETLEIKMLLSLLNAIDNPMQDIWFLGMLRGPVFDFSDDQLATIALDSRGIFYNAFVRYIADHEDDLARKCSAVLTKLRYWQNLAVSFPLSTFLDKLLQDSGLYTTAMSMRGGSQRQANLRLILDYAHSFEQGNLRGLFHFITYLGNIAKNTDTTGARALSENCDVVRIMSIHKSKGLEFPVVFLSCVSTRFNRRDQNTKLIFHPNLGIGMDYVDEKTRVKIPSIAVRAIQSRTESEMLSEEIRILYVALTRAREKLYITACLPSLTRPLYSGSAEKVNILDLWQKNSRVFETVPYYLTANAASLLDWLCYAVNPAFADLQVRPVKKIELMENQIPTTSAPITDITALDYVYHKQFDPRIPAKISVTEIKRRYSAQADAANWPGDSPVSLPNLPLAPLADAPRFAGMLSGAQIGSLTHLVLQHIPLDHPVTVGVIDDMIGRLINKHFITPDEKQYIRVDHILRFYNSPLGLRLQRSGEVYRELPFSLLLDPRTMQPANDSGDDTVLLQGIMDCIFVEENRFVLLDYKTDKTDTKTLTDRYKTQMTYYLAAAKCLFTQKKHECYLCALETGENITF